MAELKYTNVIDRDQTNDVVNAEHPICFVPREKREDGQIVHLQSVHTLSKIFKSNGLDVEYQKDGKVLFLEQHSVDVFIPTILVLWDFYLENQELIDLILKSIMEYAISKCGFKKDKSKVRFSVEIADKKVNYEGPVEGISEVKNVVKEMKK